MVVTHAIIQWGEGLKKFQFTLAESLSLLQIADLGFLTVQYDYSRPISGFFHQQNSTRPSATLSELYTLPIGLSVFALQAQNTVT